MAQSSFGGFTLPRPDKKGGGSNIKSIQSGVNTLSTSSLSTTIPISTVDMSKSIVIASVVPLSVGATNDASFATVSLQSAGTSLLVTRQGTTSNTVSLEVSWRVIEFNSVKSLQRGSNTSTGGRVVTISQIDPSKSILVYTFLTISTTSNTVDAVNDASIASSTQLSLRGSSTSSTFAWEVVEF